MRRQGPSPTVAIGLLAAGGAALAEALFTIEWSYPYCANPDSGPAYVVTGMPLPYKVYSGVSSLEHVVMPHLYAANLLILTALLYPLCRRLVARQPGRAKVAAWVGGVGLGLAAALLALSLLTQTFRPVASIADGGAMRYPELRPVGVGFNVNRASACEASPFWFPDGWTPR